MRYLGGKWRQAKAISSTMLAMSSSRTRYVEPFLGGASVAAWMVRHFERAELIDAHPDLIAMWQAALDGWQPPTRVTRREYDEQRDAPTSALRGFIGFACSFNGLWFGSYGGYALRRGYVAESTELLLKKAGAMHGACIACRDYRAVGIMPGDVVYCDPPYVGTTSYDGVEPFDHDEFWRWATSQAEIADAVFVSEYQAPAGWSAIWQQPRTATVHPTTSPAMRLDKLFVPTEHAARWLANR